MSPGNPLDVQVYCATHSVHVDERVAGYERAYPVELGDDMWIGGGVRIIGPCKIGNSESLFFFLGRPGIARLTLPPLRLRRDCAK